MESSIVTNYSFSDLANVFYEIDICTSRINKIELLGNFFRRSLTSSSSSSSSSDLLICVYFSIGKLGPTYENHELNVGEAIILRAISEVSEKRIEDIRKEYHQFGDLGLLAKSNLSLNEEEKKVSPIAFIYNKLRQLVDCNGRGSIRLKIDIIKDLLRNCRDIDAVYLVRLIRGNLRIGLKEMSIIEALGIAFTTTKLDSFQTTRIIKETYAIHSNFDNIIRCLLEYDVEQLPCFCSIQPGIALNLMLANPIKDLEKDLFKKTNLISSPITLEIKYDGERAQVHIANNNVAIFSRNLENTTVKYIDVSRRIADAFSGHNAIIDCEIVAYDKDDARILPFQTLCSRKRKHGTNQSIGVCAFLFDILYFNGKSMLNLTLQERRSILRNCIEESEGEVHFVRNEDYEPIVGDNQPLVDLIDCLMAEAIMNNCEGIMIKQLESDSTYEAYHRSNRWLKLKKDYIRGEADTLDLVVIGAYYGYGKRKDVYGSFLMACYNPKLDLYEAVCKIGNGVSNADLVMFTDCLKDYVISNAPYNYSLHESCTPDVWMDAAVVWEVNFAGFTLSPKYKAAFGIVPNRGISLRFPRFTRVRFDKDSTQASNTDYILYLYNLSFGNLI